MELTELKGLVRKHDNQLDHMLQLNSETIKKIQLQKPQRNINTTLRKRVFEVICFTTFALCTGMYIAANLEQTHLVVSGIIVHLFTLVALIGSIGQVVLLKQIDYSKPIVEIRKKIELVNAHDLFFFKLMFLSAPIWWAYALVALDFILGFDLFIYLDAEFINRYIIINLLLILPVAWAFNKLSYKNLHVQWVRNTIGFFTGSDTKKALVFLNEIEEFEN